MEVFKNILMVIFSMGSFVLLIWLITKGIEYIQKVTLYWEARTNIPAELYRLVIGVGVILLAVGIALLF